MPKISVIIPVFNTEKYIESCLNSVKNQKMKDFEIIIVNDGSTDNSENIIKQFISNNTSTDIKYFKKENGGLSSARNYGIAKANGEYIMFLDSDDYIDTNLFSNLEKYIKEKIDVIKYKAQTVNENGSIIQKLDGPVFPKCSGEEAFKKLIGKDSYIDVAWLYLYNRDFFTTNNFWYDTINKYHEDFGLTPQIIINAKTFISTGVYGYYYMQTNNSITRNEDYNKTIQKAHDVMAHYDNLLEKVKKYNITEEAKELIKGYYTNAVILKTNELKNAEKKLYIKEIRKRKMYKNIKVRNLKQLIKRIVLMLSTNLYLKMR